MKKRILVVAAVFATSMSFAQDLTTKKGETILPEADDYALGWDADPFLNYVGNFLNSGAVAPSADWATTDMSIMGKMFADAQTAYRARVRIGFGTSTTSSLTDTAVTNPLEPTYIEDVTKNSYNAITLGGGIEYRRGTTRIQGFYGGEGLINFGGSKTSIEYGQELSDNNPATRLLEDKSGTTFGLTLRGFAGVEVFVFAKTSIAFEYGWGLGFTSTGEGEMTTETWAAAPNETAPSRKEVVTKTAKTSAFGIDTDNSGGRLTLLFHF